MIVSMKTRCKARVDISGRVFDDWKRIGTKECLTSDSQIASFLIQQYQSKQVDALSAAECVHCNGLLSLYCMQCQLPARPVRLSQAGAKLLNMSSARSNSMLPSATDVRREKSEGNELEGKQHEVTSESSASELHISAHTLDFGGPVSGAAADTPSDVFSSAAECKSDAQSGCVACCGSIRGKSTQDCVTTTDTVLEIQKNCDSHIGKPLTSEPCLSHTSGRSQQHFKGVSSTGTHDVLCIENSPEIQQTLGIQNKPTQSYKRKRKRMLGQEWKSFSSSSSEHELEMVFSENKVLRPHVCSKCGACYAESHHLKRHQMTHTGERPFICQVCGWSFMEATVLKTHMRTHTGERPYTCKFCSASFTQPGTLRIHTRIHTGEKPHMCVVCGSAFTASNALTRHMRVHTDERPYICSLCGSGFKSNSDLSSHMRTHTKHKAAVCKECGATFKTKTYLKDHMRLHTGEKPFMCEVCSKSFMKNGRLKRHMLMHTGEKPHTCSVCGATFRRAETLKNHSQKVHVHVFKTVKADFTQQRE